MSTTTQQQAPAYIDNFLYQIMISPWHAGGRDTLQALFSTGASGAAIREAGF